MKIVACALLLLMLQSYPRAQEKDRWQRLQTFDESAIDIDTSNVVFGTDYTGRVRFRVTLSKPEPLSEDKGVKYKTIIQEVEFRCLERQHRIFKVTRFDNKGNPVGPDEGEPATEWKTVKKGTMMDRLLTSACNLIDEKKRNP
jgi:hypothetical protein